MSRGLRWTGWRLSLLLLLLPKGLPGTTKKALLEMPEKKLTRLQRLMRSLR